MLASQDISSKYSWMNTALFERILSQNGETIQIKQFDVQPAFGNGENYSSCLIRVNVEYFNEKAIQHTQFIIKATLGEKLVRSRDVFAKEICIYNEIVPRIEAVLKIANIPIKLTPKYENCVALFASHFIIIQIVSDALTVIRMNHI